MRSEKVSIVNELRDKIDAADFTILTDYLGLTVEQITELRSRLNGVKSRAQVVKNTALSKAVAALGCDSVDDMLNGSTAIITGSGDVTNVAKLLKDFARDHKRPVVKGGLLGGRQISGDDVLVMASLPSRESLLGTFVGTVAAPMTQLVGVMNQKVLTLLYVLQAAADKKNGE